MDPLTGMAIGAGAVNAASNAFGIGNSADKQVEQQQKLTDMQKNANAELMAKSYGMQRDMYNYTYSKNTPAQQVENLKAAGLNPALMYGLGGQGGATAGSGGAQVSGSQASSETDRQANKIAQQGMGLQLAKLQSEVDVNESIAEANRAGAKKDAADTKTTEDSRGILIENMKQAGQAQWLENIATKWKFEGKDADTNITGFYNEVYHTATIVRENGGFNQEIVKNLLKTEAETGNQNAQAFLNNEKALNAYTELMNAVANSKSLRIMAEASRSQAAASQSQAEAAHKQADVGKENAFSNRMNAYTNQLLEQDERVKSAAYALSAAWTTGEHINWKTTMDMTLGTISTLTGGIKNLGGAPLAPPK